MSAKPNIQFYTANSPNGHKVSITLEELGLSYEVIYVDLPKMEQKEPWFLAINPNGRIPALIDTMSDGSSINLFESGSIQQYLVDKYDTEHKISYPRGSKEFYQTNNWLFFQNAGVGPMQGQVAHFVRYCLAPEPIPYAIDRYVNETRRLYRTLDLHFQNSKSDYLVGNKCTIADIAIFSWANAAGFSGVDLTEFPALQIWQKRMSERVAVRVGLDIPVKVDLDKLAKDPQLLNSYLKNNKAWIRQGMEEDSK